MKSVVCWIAWALLVSGCSSDGGGAAGAPGSGGTGDGGVPDAPGSDAPAADAPPPVDAQPPPPVDWAACDTGEWPAGYPKPSEPIECTFLDVPLDHDAPDGKTLALRVARQRSAAYPTGRAVFVLEGGPGGSAVFTSGLIPKAMPGLLDGLDLVYVDARGTGGSGYLSCPKTPVTTADWVACGEAHAETDLDHYLSRDVARDLDAVRERLGYAAIHLFAASYGTRVAFDYLRLFEDKVVAGVLDGVAPPPTDLFTNSVTAGDRGVDLLVQDCSNAPACVAVAPDLGSTLLERRKMLETSPRPITINGQLAFEALSDYVALLHGLIGKDYWRYRVPKAVHQSVAGDHGLWNQLMTEAIGSKVTDAPTGTAPPLPSAPPLLGPRVSDLLPEPGFGAQFSSRAVNAAVLCAEALPNSPGLDALNASWAAQLWATPSAINKANACSAWAVSPLPASERAVVSSSRPLLLLSGAADVNLDPKWAKVALGGLSQGKLIEVPYATHLPTYVPCVGKLNAAYLRADGDYSKVDDSCAKNPPAPAWN